MHLIDDIHTLFHFCRRIYRVIPNGTDIVHAVVGGCVDLLHIQNIARVDPPTGGAAIAGVSVHRIFTVHRLGHNFGAGGFAGTVGTGKQIRMAKLTGHKLISQRGGDRPLTDHIVKGLRPVFPV